MPIIPKRTRFSNSSIGNPISTLGYEQTKKILQDYQNKGAGNPMMFDVNSNIASSLDSNDKLQEVNSSPEDFDYAVWSTNFERTRPRTPYDMRRVLGNLQSGKLQGSGRTNMQRAIENGLINPSEYGFDFNR